MGVGFRGRQSWLLENPIALARCARKTDYGFPIRIAVGESLENLARFAVPTFLVEFVFRHPVVVRLEQGQPHVVLSRIEL